jgi:hypothetical protein
MQSEKADLAASHYRAVSELSSKVQELLAKQAAMTAAHRKEAAAMQGAHKATEVELENEKRASIEVRGNVRAGGWVGASK